MCNMKTATVLVFLFMVYILERVEAFHHHHWSFHPPSPRCCFYPLRCPPHLQHHCHRHPPPRLPLGPNQNDFILSTTEETVITEEETTTEEATTQQGTTTIETTTDITTTDTTTDTIIESTPGKKPPSKQHAVITAPCQEGYVRLPTGECKLKF